MTRSHVALPSLDSPRAETSWRVASDRRRPPRHCSDREDNHHHHGAAERGCWRAGGRTLKIGELYAKSLLARVGHTPAEAGQIAYQLVYGYTHHRFPIDLDEAARIGLRPQMMKEQEYSLAAKLLGYCVKDELFVGFIGEHSGSRCQEAPSRPQVRAKAGQLPPLAAEVADRDGEDIARPHGQAIGAVEEGQHFTASDAVEEGQYFADSDSASSLVAPDD